MSTLVIGANGFLGSHVTRQLVESGADVRAMVRHGANTVGIDDLALQRFYGDVFDTGVLREAMTGCDFVYYCVVDTRAWLRDPSPLFRTNVEGTRNVLEVARTMKLQRFVFTSSYVTIGRRPARPWNRGHRATEEDTVRRRRSLGPYGLSRLQAEEVALRYAYEHGVPVVAMCVSTTYGSRDWGMTPQGAMVAGAAFGKVPFVMKGISLEAVGVDDAARALILAASHGRNGERYIISEKMLSNPEIAGIAARAAGVSAPSRAISLPVLYGMAAMGSLKGRLRGSDELLTLRSLRLMRA
ncbi:MAG: NAD-dependent epimerase/dehydratase family protein, partial [Mycobacteriaceae bacterium]|nr:NAD-dependent epimerase/dehydratase family protein [Mycobacteriaceae bacterium]